MTNEELKKKITEILEETEYEWTEEKNGYILQIFYDKLADALIAAGIGDVTEWKEKAKKHRVQVLPDGTIKQLYSDEEVEDIARQRDEYKHRAEVAERALRNAAPRLKCRGGLGEGFCGVDKCDYYHCNNDEGCVKAHLQQAEKELAEEGKE